jgi:hypothetical protein
MDAPSSGDETARVPAYRLRRTLLGAMSAVVSINIWTGSPLLAVWLGSRVQRVNSGPSMGAITLVLVALVVQSLLLVRLLTALNRSYDALIGREQERWQSPWLRSLRAERASDTAARRRPLTIVDRLVVLSVVVAVGAFEVWFFFFAGSSLPHS